MVSITENSTSAIGATYTMSDLPFLQLAEAARALAWEGATTQVPDEMRAQISLVAAQQTIDSDDIDREIQELVLRIGNANDPAIAAARNYLMQNFMGKPLSQMGGMSAYLETLTISGQARTDANDGSDSPQARLQQAWAQFDRADRDLDRTFNELPLTEVQRREYERLKEQELDARERYNQNPTRENFNQWQAATETTSSYVNQTIDEGVATGQFTPQQAAPVVTANQTRDTAIDTVNDNVMALYEQDRTLSVEHPESADSHGIGTVDSMDLAIPAAGQPAVAASRTTVEQPYAMADISLAETGQFTPDSASQPGISTGSRGV